MAEHRSRPNLAWAKPRRGARADQTGESPLPTSEALACALSDWFQLGQQDCLDIRRDHNAPHNVLAKARLAAQQAVHLIA